MKRGTGFLMMAAALSAFTANGCIFFAPPPQEVKGAPYPSPSDPPRHERMEAKELKANVSPADNALDVTVGTPVQCRDWSPMVQDVEMKRSTNTMEQSINLGSFLLFGGLGTYGLFADCEVTPDPTKTDPNPASRPCNSKEKGATNALIGTSLVVGALAGAAFVYNIVRARDTKETVRLESPPSEWKACDSKPLANTPVRLLFAGGQQVEGATDSTGKVRFDVRSIEWSDDVFRPGQAKLAIANRDSDLVLSLDSLPQYVEWKQRTAQQAQQRTQTCQAECKDGWTRCIVELDRKFGCLRGQQDCTHVNRACDGLVEQCNQQCTRPR